MVTRRARPARADGGAVRARQSERAQVCDRNFDIPAHYGSYQQLLDDPNAEAVHVANVNDDHAEWTIKAADALANARVIDAIRESARTWRRAAAACQD